MSIPIVTHALKQITRKDTRLKSMMMEKLFPILSDVEVIIMEVKRMPPSFAKPYGLGFTRRYAVGEFYRNIERDSSEVSIWFNMNDLYQLRRREIHYSDDDEESESDEEEGDTFVAFVYADDINNFIEESSNSITKYEVDPLARGGCGETDVYVYSPTTFPPNGFSELLSTGATVHLVISEEVVDEILKNNSLSTKNQKFDKHVK